MVPTVTEESARERFFRAEKRKRARSAKSGPGVRSGSQTQPVALMFVRRERRSVFPVQILAYIDRLLRWVQEKRNKELKN